MKKWLGALGFSILCGVGTVGVMTLANDDTTPIVIDQPTNEQPVVIEQPKERISFEYYTITEEAVKNSWTCGTIDRCDMGKISVYIYDPALIGEHKFNIFARIDVLQADLVVVFVNQYNEVLGTETYTLEANPFHRGFMKVIDVYPPGTKYVKFADLTNIVYK